MSDNKGLQQRMKFMLRKAEWRDLALELHKNVYFHSISHRSVLVYIVLVY
jgi:hypothetical protein